MASDRSSLSPTPTQQQPTPLKRKRPSDEPLADESKTPEPTPVSDTIDDLSKGEYQTGRVTCETCGLGVSFRDEQTGGFTLKRWNEHRLTCATSSHTSAKPNTISPGDIMVRTPSHPPVKRRRAKRTEEERIEYLRDDPYVAKFEAYRVLCASCNKWIRLRPNSTFCSIPWDAHRKSCLSKKTNSNNLHAVEERNTFFSQDPFVRKFDSERVLCNKCDKWISLDAEDHAQAVQAWVQHRDACHDTVPTPRTIIHHSIQTAASPSALGPSSSSHETSPLPPQASAGPSADGSTRHSFTHQVASSPPFHDLNPANYAPNHDSRRRNAEQRAATLRADPLITQVEPNRVFCSLCHKWVQLRQDSSYCAYPWLQHRGKCLARHQRRTQKAAQNLKRPVRSIGGGSRSLQEHDEPESEEGVDSSAEEGPTPQSHGYHRAIHHRHHRPSRGEPFPRLSPIHHGSITALERHQVRRPGYAYRTSPASSSFYRGPAVVSRTTTTPTSVSATRERMVEDDDRDADADGEGESYVEDDRSPSATSARQGPSARRSFPGTCADLDTPHGRKQFLFASVDHLFRTTYERSDDMPISALLAYLNAAIPQDKHEDFDTCEVVKGVVALQERGWMKLEGDILRVVE